MAGMLGMILDQGDILSTDRIFDLRYGTGASTFEAAQRVPDDNVLGVDISEAFHEPAAGRANVDGVRNASFLLADAQTHDLSAQPFDLLVSRLGMIFLADTNAAFRSLSGAMNDHGKMVFVCWAPVAKNAWFEISKTRRRKGWALSRKGFQTRRDRTHFRIVIEWPI